MIMRKLLLSSSLAVATALIVFSCDRPGPEQEPVLPPAAPVITNLSGTLDDQLRSTAIRFEVEIAEADSAYVTVTAPDGSGIYRNSVTVESTSVIDLDGLVPETTYRIDAVAVNMSENDGPQSSSASLEITTAAGSAPDPGTEYLTLVEATENSYTFRVSDYSGFDSGIFYAEATGSGGRAISQNISFTVPLDELDVSDPVIMRQHYKITLPVADGVSESLFTLDLINVPTAKLSLRSTGNGHETELIISDLSSDTSYMGGRIIAGNTEIPIEAFTTEDFSGTYAYRCSVDNPGKSYMDAFIVDVKFAKESNPDSLYKYYFFASPDDPFNTDRSTKIRMSPLLDGEVPFGERIDYADGNTAYQVSYRWNNKKWNFNELATVYNWTVISYDASADSYTSEAISKGGLSSALSTDATTTSSYNLIEDEDGNAYLVFFNKITSTDSLSQVGNSYIRKNLDADSGLFGENAPYTFVLSLEG